jgi:hypothetical protein
MMFRVNISFDVHVKAKDADEAYHKVAVADPINVFNIARNMEIKVDEPGYKVLNQVKK